VIVNKELDTALPFTLTDTLVGELTLISQNKSIKWFL